jgi:hypothetical protein
LASSTCRKNGGGRENAAMTNARYDSGHRTLLSPVENGVAFWMTFTLKAKARFGS